MDQNISTFKIRNAFMQGFYAQSKQPRWEIWFNKTGSKVAITNWIAENYTIQFKQANRDV